MKGGIHSHVLVRQGEFFVGLQRGGEQIDEAGPFDDELDATEAAKRMGDVCHPLSRPYHGTVWHAWNLAANPRRAA